MDLHHTGSDKILEICTDKVSIVIKSKGRVVCGDTSESSVGVTAEGLRYIKSEVCGIDDSYELSCPACVRVKAPPLFFENTDYEIVVQSCDGGRLSFWHNSSEVRERVGYVTVGELGLLSGIVNFGNNIGYSELEIFSDGSRTLILRLEVFPSVMGYKEQYRTMMDDITREVYSTAIGIMQKTYQEEGVGQSGTSTPALFFQILSAIFEKYMKAANILIAHPHHKLAYEYGVLPAHKIRRTDAKSEKWLMKHSEYAVKRGNGIGISKTLGVQRQVTYDTEENRFARFILLSTVKRLVDFKKRYIASFGDDDAYVTERADKMIASVKGLASAAFFKDVGEYRAVESMSLVFGMAPGYRELYKYYLILKSGLSVGGDVFKISMRDTKTLYEYWCFIKLVSIMKRKKYRLFSDDIIKVSGNGITVDLAKGRDSELVFFNPRTGEKIFLRYNAVSNEDTEDYDTVISLEKSTDNKDGRYIFSPRYNVSLDKEGNVVSPSGDISELYRYRDAFNGRTGGRLAGLFGRDKGGAYTLFPYAEEKIYEQSRAYRKADKINVGGLPFLPNATGLVEKLLEGFLADGDSDGNTTTLLPFKLEGELAAVDWGRFDVLVGSVGSAEQFGDNIARRYYYVPEANVNKSLADLRYIALYQSTNMFGSESGIRYFGEITQTKRLKRKDIHFPMRRKNGEEWYYAFRVKSWRLLDYTVSVKDEGVFGPRFTNMFLLQNCRHSYELFNIQSADQYRLVYELNKIFKESNTKGDGEESCEIYRNGKISVWRGRGVFEILNEKGERLLDPPINISDFSKHPRNYYNLIADKLTK